jgi:hypothetical protein
MEARVAGIPAGSIYRCSKGGHTLLAWLLFFSSIFTLLK